MLPQIGSRRYSRANFRDGTELEPEPESDFLPAPELESEQLEHFIQSWNWSRSWFVSTWLEPWKIFRAHHPCTSLVKSSINNDVLVDFSDTHQHTCPIIKVLASSTPANMLNGAQHAFMDTVMLINKENVFMYVH